MRLDIGLGLDVGFWLDVGFRLDVGWLRLEIGFWLGISLLRCSIGFWLGIGLLRSRICLLLDNYRLRLWNIRCGLRLGWRSPEVEAGERSTRSSMLGVEKGLGDD